MADPRHSDYGEGNLYRSGESGGVVARAHLEYRTPKGPKPKESAAAPAPPPTTTVSEPTAAKDVTINLPQFSLCETRTLPADPCAYYQLAPAAPDKKRNKKPPRPSPEQLAQEAMDRAIALAMQPKLTLAPSGVGLTGLDTYVWLADEPQPITARAIVPGLAVTAEARPVEYTWTFGDGATKVTTHSGRRWTRRRAGNISHLYEQRGTYELGIDVRWEARWRIGAEPWLPLGTFTNSDSTTYPVRQIVAVLVRAN